MILILYIYYMQESNPQSGPPNPWTKPLYVSDSPYGQLGFRGTQFSDKPI